MVPIVWRRGRRITRAGLCGVAHDRCAQVVLGQLSMVGFGAMTADGKGNIYAGERDRIARLVRYRLKPKAPEKSAAPPGSPPPPPADDTPPAKLPCHVAFAPQGTTTDGSGYTAIEVGKDGKVKDVRVVKTIPMLEAAAIAAVKQWVFKPALSNNKPVAVWVAVPVKFTLH